LGAFVYERVFTHKVSRPRSSPWHWLLCVSPFSFVLIVTLYTLAHHNTASSCTSPLSHYFLTLIHGSLNHNRLIVSV
jgi:hypothetical protein